MFENNDQLYLVFLKHQQPKIWNRGVMYVCEVSAM